MWFEMVVVLKDREWWRSSIQTIELFRYLRYLLRQGMEVVKWSK